MNKKIILITFIILIIILIFLIIGLNNEKESQINNQIQDNTEKRIDEYLIDKVIPSGLYRFSQNYKGDLSREELYTNLSKMVNYISNLSENLKNVDDDKLTEFFEKNSSTIRLKLGIEEESDFISLAKYIKTVGLNKDIKFKSCEIDTATFENEEEYLNFKLKLFYEDLNNEITVKISFANNSSTIPKLICRAVEDS